jgi:hypothetical protein
MIYKCPATFNSHANAFSNPLMANGSTISPNLARRRRIGPVGGNKMKTFQQLSSGLMMATAAAMMGIPVLFNPQEWQTSLCELDTFLIVFTLLCTAILLWPRSESATVQQ